MGVSLRVNGQIKHTWTTHERLQHDMEVYDVPTVNITSDIYHVVMPQDAPQCAPIRVGKYDIVTVVKEQLIC